jgi:seryl-tRNA synthetase
MVGIWSRRRRSCTRTWRRRAGSVRAYRPEAGARGVESKGLYRVREFTKVELFAWTAPDAVFVEMLDLQKTFQASLGLHARVLEMPTTDLGASASRKIDIEAYMPSRADRDPWGGVSSLSNCTDYQSRRLNTRLKMDSAGAKKTV